MIYEPAEDSFLLEKQVRKLAKNKRVLDMGTGSLIQANAARKAGALEVTVADSNPEAIVLGRKNGFLAYLSDLFTQIPKQKFDLIVFNPPYLPQDEREDSQSAQITSGGKNGDELALRFLKQALAYLSPQGKILLLVSSLTPSKRLTSLLAQKGLSKRVIAKEKLFMEHLEVWLIGRKKQQ